MFMAPNLRQVARVALLICGLVLGFVLSAVTLACSAVVA